MHALPLILGALAVMAIAYRWYSLFLARSVAVLDDQRETPAYRLQDGQNYHPTNRWVLFGHHFAAISGAGPLIGPVLAVQYGYAPGLLWLVIGVCIAGAVQDMLVLAASVRHDGKSLAEMARRMLGRSAGGAAALAILFIVIIALSGLGLVVVKALGGETIKLPTGTQIAWPLDQQETLPAGRLSVPGGSELIYPNGVKSTRSDAFELVLPQEVTPQAGKVTVPAGTVEPVAGSSWGTFTIFCTIPIAFLVGLYMYKIRPGHTFEASLVGAVGILAATYAGSYIPDSAMEPYFSLGRQQTILAICGYGFVASVLPVWMLLCPRDYISSFLKIGTIAILVLGIMLANPVLEAPPVNRFFAQGGGPLFPGGIFPFVFICVMCGSISGFHSLVSSGTTPKMIGKESHIRAIGYGAMLLEGLVGVVALLVAAALPRGDFWAINIDISKIQDYAGTLVEMGANIDHLPVIEKQVGGESLRGRTGGAVTLAVGMAQMMTTAMQRFMTIDSIDTLIKHWYHFAIMFEALFILTTIDTGTRIARFLLQELLGKIHPRFEQVDWAPGVWISTALVTLGWGGLIWTGSIETIWPMFGVANQFLAMMALIVVSSYLLESGRGRYLWVTLIPLAFISVTTVTAAVQLIQNRFLPMFLAGQRDHDWSRIVPAVLNTAGILAILSCVVWVAASLIAKRLSSAPRN